MSTNTTKVEVFKALGDNVRLSIVQKLASVKDELASCDILACSSVHKLSQPAMSHHFGRLVEAGVLEESKQGTQKMYRLNRQLLESTGIDITKL